MGIKELLNRIVCLIRGHKYVEHTNGNMKEYICMICGHRYCDIIEQKAKEPYWASFCSKCKIPLVYTVDRCNLPSGARMHAKTRYVRGLIVKNGLFEATANSKCGSCGCKTFIGRTISDDHRVLLGIGQCQKVKRDMIKEGAL